MVTLRDARESDLPALARIDEVAWSPAVTPAPAPQDALATFTHVIAEHDVIVALVDSRVAGFVVVAQTLRLPSHEHVLEIKDLAVDSEHRRKGVGRALVMAASERARDRGALKLSLRVLGTNPGARRLYESCGFAVEGVLRSEFLIGGELVDDLLMAHHLGRSPDEFGSPAPS